MEGTVYPVIRTEEETKEIINQKLIEGLHQEGLKRWLVKEMN